MVFEWIQPHPEGCLIEVRVVPGAASDAVVGEHDGALKVRVTAAPEKGRATKAVAALLQSATGARSVRLERGMTSRRKTFVLVGVSRTVASRRLGS